MKRSIINFCRKPLRALLPSLYKRISWYRNEGRLIRIGKKIGNRYKYVVQTGPFSGTRYVNAAVGSVYCPKLVGSYESPLAPFIERAIIRGYTQIVDIGCAEGYYAVGLARRMPSTEVFAFDIDPAARRLCSELATLNEASHRVHIREGCNSQNLNNLNLQNAFIVCDCEGAEVDILKPETVPRLATCSLIVEIHDHLRPGVSEELLSRFSSTHRLEFVRASLKKPTDFPCLSFLPEADRTLAIEEFRKDAKWAVISPKNW